MDQIQNTQGLPPSQVLSSSPPELVCRLVDGVGRKALAQRIIGNDHTYNGPKLITAKASKKWREAAHYLAQNCSVEQLDYDGITKINASLAAFYGSDDMCEAMPAGATPLPSGVPEEYEGVYGHMYAALDAMDVKPGEPIRILVPGNNDQANAIYVALQVKVIQTYMAGKGLSKNNIEVLFMGKGGHPTTANFPSIGRFENGEFEGVSEAVSLSDTAKAALSQYGIGHRVIEGSFGDEPGTGELLIKLASDSTNTGENVREALAAGPVAKHLFVAAAKTASGRQEYTFAHQLWDADVPAFGRLASVSLPRTQTYLERSLTNFQLVEDYLQSLGERVRHITYSVNPKGRCCISSCG